jgi:hypothetical protein
MAEMTTDMRRAMARYEEARAAYQRAVLASLDGRSKGEAIRQAIAEFRVAQQELRRFRPRVPPASPPSESEEEEEGSLLSGLSFFRRLLSPG